MKTIYHRSFGIRKLLKSKKPLDGVLTNADDESCSHDEAVAYLTQKLREGWKVLPHKDCDNFSPVKGCLGHDPGSQE